MKIIEADISRSTLLEGRSYGLGFSILKKENRKLKKLIPTTACKDYLNDIVHIENYNVITGYVYGFNHSYSNYFEIDKVHMYMLLEPLHYKNGGE